MDIYVYRDTHVYNLHKHSVKLPTPFFSAYAATCTQTKGKTLSSVCAQRSDVFCNKNPILSLTPDFSWVYFLIGFITT